MSPPSSASLALPADHRVVAIDMTRAVTMLLMIFVNDLWTVTGVPAWLEHAAPGVDAMGLADTVFPAFLFIVGLSLPFAIDSRRDKGDSTALGIGHIVLRSLALIVMGVFMVNGEGLNEQATGLMRWMWNLLICGSFLLIWNRYPPLVPAWGKWSLRGLGGIILLSLAVICRAGDAGQVQGFGPQWWGILGIIGWSYLLVALVVMAAGGRMAILALAWVILVGVSMLGASGQIPAALDLLPSPLRDGTHAALVMGGAITGALFRDFVSKRDPKGLTLCLAAMAAGLLVAAQLTRPLWGLSKISATPPWLFLCSALTILLFLAMYWICDIWGKSSWFGLLRPAGSDTLLTYLTPYLVYPVVGFAYFNLPEVMTTGVAGLVKSVIFAIGCILVAGSLSRWVRLKL